MINIYGNIYESNDKESASIVRVKIMHIILAVGIANMLLQIMKIKRRRRGYLAWLSRKH